MNNLYDNPDIYNLLHNESFEEKLQIFYQALFTNADIKTMHDCSFGTGNLSIVLKLMGYQLSGSDINDKMLARATEICKQRRLDIPLFQADFTNLSKYTDKLYDCVMATGNSLAHVTGADLLKALIEMDRCIKPGGYLYFDSRNWDKILREKKRFYTYNPSFKDAERINLVQVWDYHDNDEMIFNFLYTFEKDSRIIRRETYSETYYPLKLSNIKAQLIQMGYHIQKIVNFGSVDVTDIEEMDWYALLAKK